MTAIQVSVSGGVDPLDAPWTLPESWLMDRVSPLPSNGAVFFDPRDEGRSLRVSYHEALGVFVLSLWRGSDCLGSFRMSAEDSPRLVHSLMTSLATSRPTATESEASAG